MTIYDYIEKKKRTTTKLARMTAHNVGQEINNRHRDSVGKINIYKRRH